MSGASAGASREALSSNLAFFIFASASGSILPLSDPLLEALWLSLGAFWAPLVAPGALLWGPRGLSGALRAPLWALLEALWGALGRPWASRWLPGRSGDRFGVDLGSIFGRIRSEFGWICRCSLRATVLSWCFDCSFDGLLPSRCSFDRPGLSNSGPSHLCAARVASTG